MLLRTTVGLIFVVGGLALPASCGGSAGAFCDAKCECEICNDFDYDRCVRDYEYDADRADALGCFDFFDAYAACVEDFGGCYDDRCKPERDRWKDCID